MGEYAKSGITVVATEPADKELMEGTLRRTGLRSVEVRRDEVVDRGVLEEPVTIVCHREANGRIPAMSTGRHTGTVLVSSDCKAEWVVIETLETGAHHFFDIDESPRLMQARLSAALRSRPKRSQDVLRVRPFRFDPDSRRAWRNGRLIALTPKEFDLAYYLFSHREKFVEDSELMLAIWSLPRTSDTRRISTAASRLRKKMGLEPSDAFWWLKRLRSKGYKLIPVELRLEPECADIPGRIRLADVVQHTKYLLFGDILVDRHRRRVLVPVYLLNGLQVLTLIVQQLRRERSAPLN